MRSAVSPESANFSPLPSAASPEVADVPPQPSGDKLPEGLFLVTAEAEDVVLAQPAE